MKTKLSNAFKISSIYFLISLIWIYVSDEVISLISEDKNILATMQLGKGLFFITISSLIIYYFLSEKYKEPVFIKRNKMSKNITYLISIILTLITFSIYKLIPFDSSEPIVILFTIPVIISAYIGGIIPGVISTLVSVILIQKFLISHTGDLEDYVKLLTLITSGILISITSELLIRSNEVTKKLSDTIEFEATHDNLTELMNRLEFERILQRVLNSAKNLNTEHVLCYLDLDHFKIINDSSGHAAGDALLKQIKFILLESYTFRERDIIARIGGDEFVILLENCNIERAFEISQSVISNINEFKFVWNNKTYKIGVSIGITKINSKSESVEQILSQADVACYTAKNLGRNRIELYKGKSEETHSDIIVISEIQNNLDTGKFKIYYQPIKNLKDNFINYEALIRLEKNNGEIILPENFILSAERYNKALLIDKWVINEVFRMYKYNFRDTPPEISINLSANSVVNENLFEFICNLFKLYDIDQKNICFEITETSIISNLEYCLSFMNNIKSIGCKLSLDDFGAGMSSFGYLKILPVDYLKIDGIFIKNITENLKDLAIVRAIIEMSKTMGIQTIAEHVETENCLELLTNLGVDHIQGFILGRPIPLN